MTKLIYIGDDFYSKSKSAMSCIYKAKHDGYERYDWGFVQRDLRDGKEVTIRPATHAEVKFFEDKLAEMEE
jgi:hypothetical protein